MEPELVPLTSYEQIPASDMAARARTFAEKMKHRRTVRDFSSKPVPRSIIDDCIKAALTAPNGANQQPWHFVVIEDPTIKSQIREAAEEEEHTFYHGRAPQAWLDALKQFGTDEHKPFLEKAPYLIAIFAQNYGVGPVGDRVKHYYVQESVGIATGILITALHHTGLATLTHTPSPMGFLNKILGRPANERPYLLLVVGYPDEAARVPKITKKPFDEVVTYV